MSRNFLRASLHATAEVRMLRSGSSICGNATVAIRANINRITGARRKRTIAAANGNPLVRRHLTFGQRTKTFLTILWCRVFHALPSQTLLKSDTWYPLRIAIECRFELHSRQNAGYRVKFALNQRPHRIWHQYRRSASKRKRTLVDYSSNNKAFATD